MRTFFIGIFLAIQSLFVAWQNSYGMGSPGPPNGVATAENQVIQILRQGTEIAQQAQMIHNQFQSLKGLSGSWESVFEELFKLHRIVEEGKALAYSLSNLEEAFKAAFPGYEPPEDFVLAYKNWTETTLDTISASLKAAGFQSRQFRTEEATMSTLRALSDSALGQSQALAAGNRISAEVVSQLQKLRQLQMAQIQSESSFMAYQVNKDAQLKAVIDDFFRTIPERGRGRRY